MKNSDQPILTQITPFVPCTDLQKQIAFYRDILGFTVGFEADNYAFLRRDNTAFRLIEVWKSVDLKQPERLQTVYIDVKHIDALYASLRDKLSTLPAERVKAPFNQDFGQREFHITDEDCTIICFGEAISSDDG